MPEYLTPSCVKLQDIIDKLKNGAELGIDDRARVAFLPEGKHQIRWFMDPNSDLFRESVMHQIAKRRVHCLDAFAQQHPDREYPPCDFCRIAKETGNWRLERRPQYLIYGHLCETNNESYYWQAGQTYVIVGTFRMQRALSKMMETMLKQEASDYVITMLNPKLNGFITSVGVEKGQKGYVRIDPIPAKTIPALTLGEWYRPLSACWVPQEPNMTDYQRALAAYMAGENPGGTP